MTLRKMMPNEFVIIDEQEKFIGTIYNLAASERLANWPLAED